MQIAPVDGIIITLLLSFSLICCIFAEKNRLIAEPEVDCAKDAIFINFVTQLPFKGTVFIRGRHSDPNCFTGATLNNSVSLLIPHLDCGVSRHRSLNPLGVYMGTTVVISFHPSLVTIGDNIFSVECFYQQDTSKNREPHNITSNKQTPPLPACTYQIQRYPSSPGDVRYASLGERLVHSWSCAPDSGPFSLEEEEEHWCILVHNCYMHTHNALTRVNLTDSAGCSLDTALIGDMHYYSPSLAVTRVAASKFADRQHVEFNCQISATRRIGEQACVRPQCDTTDKSDRAARDIGAWLKLYSYTQDVSSPSMSVLDVDESLNSLPAHISADYPSQSVSWRHQNMVCVSSLAFAIVVSAIFVVAITTIIIIAILAFKRTCLTL